MDLWDDACAQAELVRSGEVSPAELVDAAIARIEAREPAAQRRHHRAVRQGPGGGRRACFRRARSAGCRSSSRTCTAPRRAIHATRAPASCRQAGVVADHDAAVVRRFREAGFVIVGRTNTPELGTTITTEPLSFGPSRNPWDPSRSTGGSSGGSAAAVASGMVPVAHASDGGGSIRIPASECGLVGLKPARARVSRGPDRGRGVDGGVDVRRPDPHRARRRRRARRDAPAPSPATPMPLPPAGAVGHARWARTPVRCGSACSTILSPDAPADAQAADAVTAGGRLLEGLGHQVQRLPPAGVWRNPSSPTSSSTSSPCTPPPRSADWARILGREVADEELEPTQRPLRGDGPVGDRPAIRGHGELAARLLPAGGPLVGGRLGRAGHVRSSTGSPRRSAG